MTIVTSLYLYQGVFNNAMVKFENDKDRYISAMQGLILALNIIAFLVYIFAFQFWSDLLGLSPVIVLLMFAEMLVSPSLQFWSGRQRFEYKYKRLVKITLIKSVLNPFLGVVAVLMFKERDIARIASVVVSEFIVCGAIMIYQFAKGKTLFKREYWKYALTLAIPLLPHYLSGMILNQSDRIMIGKLVGTSEVAFYSIAYSIGMLSQIFTSALNSSFTPWMYQRIREKEYTGVSSTINALLSITAIVTLCLMLLSPELVSIFGSKEYSSAVYVIPPVAASVFFIFMYNLLAVPQFFYEKTRYLMLSSIFAAILNVILNFVFISWFGYVAAGYTTLVCYVLYGFGHYLISTHILGRVLPGVRLYDPKFIVTLAIIIILCGILCNFLFNHLLLRYVTILVCILLMILKKSQIIGMVSGMRNVKQS